MRFRRLEAARGRQHARGEEKGKVPQSNIRYRALTYYKRKVNKESLRRKAVGLPEIKDLNTKLAQFGY
jgi:hypothetical protein